jgi:hypothetical protein
MFQRAAEMPSAHSEQRWFDVYLLDISSPSRPILQKQLSVGYEKLDSVCRHWHNPTGFPSYLK